jgi:hypothetical protein
MKIKSLPTHKSSTKCFHGWRMDSKVQTAPVGSEIIIENWDATESEIFTETACTADAWTAQIALVGSEIIKEN